MTIVTDVGVPVTALPKILDAAQAKIVELGLIAPMCGHMADGNFHYAILVDAAQEDEIRRATAFKTWLAEWAQRIQQREIDRLRQADQCLKNEIEALETEKAKLENMKSKIETDPEYIEKIAREKYKMKKKEEKVYEIVEE